MSPDDLISSYELYYNDSHFRQNVHVTISPPSNTHLLTDLTPDTVYHVRVAAKSARGEGASTPTVQVRTLDYGTPILRYITLEIFKVALVKTSRTTGRSKPNKLQYYVRIKLIAETNASSVFVGTPVETAQM